MRRRVFGYVGGLVALLALLAAGCTGLNEPGLQCNGQTPKYCPPLNDAPEACVRLTDDCATLTQCGTAAFTCPMSNEYVDCGLNECVGHSTCMNINNYADACTQCFIRKCCGEWGACNSDPNCTMAGNDANWQALTLCDQTYCTDVCLSSS